MQLVYDYEFKNVLEAVNIWNDIPDNIIFKIKDIVNSTILYNFVLDKYLCPICLNELENYHCRKCNKFYNNDRLLFITNDSEWYSFLYYIFDVQRNVFLYELEVSVPIDMDKYLLPYKKPKICIKTIYEVLKNGINDIKNNKFYPFKDYVIELDNVFNMYENSWLDIDNLEDLKNTDIYKYSNIWLLKDHFNKNGFNLASITYFPIYTIQFEYLVKMGLYNLAINGCDYLNEGNTFKSIFGVEKKYYNFMKKIDITPLMLSALRVYQTDNIDLLKFMDGYSTYLADIYKYVDIKKLKEYFEMQGLSNDNIIEYYDYIKWCKKLELDLKSKKVLYPDIFIEAHDRLEKEIVINMDNNIENKIKNLSLLLNVNKYEDDKYVIFPADSIDSLLDESRQMHNCVRTYIERYSNNECQIYFMRYKDSKDKSLVTIEVKNGKVVQAREKYNKNIGDVQRRIIDKWSKNLVTVENI